MSVYHFHWLVFVSLLFQISICSGSCPAQGVWSITPFGHRAVLPCNIQFGVTYYSGYSYRLCAGTEINPSWGNIVSNCTYLPLCNLTYPLKSFYRVGNPVTLTPTYSGYADSWTVSPSLPPSLRLDERAGTLHGAFSASFEGEFTITAFNKKDNASVILRCDIRDETSVTLLSIPLSPSQRSLSNTRANIFSVERIGVLPPTDLRYPLSTLVAYSNIEISPLIPSFQGEDVRFFSQPKMPSDILLNTTTGVISGKAIEQRNCSLFLIGVRNDVGSSSFPLQICVFAGDEGPVWSMSNSPKGWFWHSLTLCVVLFVFVFVFAVLRCVCVAQKRHMA